MTTFNAVDANGASQAIALNDDPPKAAKQDAQTALLTTIDGRVDGVEAALALLSTAAGQTALQGLVGEVQASPTANTVLDRLKAITAAVQAPALTASGVAAYTPEALVSSTRSTHFAPAAGREFYCRISGAGSAVVTLVYSLDGGTNYDPQATGVDGSAPIIMDQVAYNGATQNGILLTGDISKYGARVAILPGTVTGTVTVGFDQ